MKSKVDCSLGGVKELGQGRNSALDSLRGLAAVSVIFYHAVLVVTPEAVGVIDPPIQGLDSTYLQSLKVLLALVSGHSAVLLFFVLSGFVLMLSMDRDFERGQWSVVSFVFRRFMRLYPALFAALVMCFAIGVIAVHLGSDSSSFARAADPVQTLQNLLLWNTSMHGATWTIQVEFLAIPFLIIAFWASLYAGPAGLLACLVVAILEAQSRALTSFSTELGGVLFAFYGGMLAAKLIGGRPSTKYGSAAICLMTVLYVVVDLPAPRPSNGLLIAKVLTCVGLIVAVYSALDCVAVRILNNRHLLKLGRISYSLYLLNVPVMWLMLSIASHFHAYTRHPVLIGLLIGVVTTLITIPIADLFERAIERPANALGKRLTTRSRPTVEAAAE